ncbi:hypothetical protein QUF70_05725, partial [Desulfobacterales bacterium HSG17]|nr:hypothetical protein [Desulfobacterales bacterium HSG17]
KMHNIYLVRCFMIVTINIPDTLPEKRIWQRIREIEESLKKEAIFFQSIIEKKDLSENIFDSFSEQSDQWPDFTKRAQSVFGKNPPGKNVSNYLKESREDRF